MAGNGNLKNIYRVLIQLQQKSEGAINVKLLEQHCGYNSTLQLIKIFSNHNEYFRLEQRDNSLLVSASTNINYCDAHCGKNGCYSSSGECDGLHLCKYAINGRCDIKADKCQFGHSLDTHHNQAVLAKYMLDLLPLDLILYMLRQIPIVPRVCKFYNVEGGCRRGESGNKCSSLHVCKFYLTNQCTFGSSCKRSHDIFDPQPKQILIKHGFDVTSKPPHQIVEEVRRVFKEEIVMADEDLALSSPPTRDKVSSLVMPRWDGQWTEPRVRPIKWDTPTKATTLLLGRPKQAGLDSCPLQVCKHYSVARGCNNDTSCNFLHLCRYFLYGNCSYGGKCKRNHNVLDPQVVRILGQHGIHVSGKNPQLLLQEVRRSCQGGSGSSSPVTPIRSPIAPLSAPVSPDRTPSPMVQKTGAGARPKTSLPDRQMPVSSTTQIGDVPDICMYNLRGQCSFGSSCKNVHCRTSYQWQFLDDSNEWTDITGDANSDLEINYCDPSRDSCYADIDELGVMKVDFDKMATTNEDIQIRRLSTVSAVTASHKLKLYSTQWQWYFRDHSDTWVEYGEKVDDSLANVRSANLEESFLNKPKGLFKFSTNNFAYVVDFSAMEQRNQKLGTRRKIKRRPLLPSSEKTTVRARVPSESREETPRIPSHWQRMRDDEPYRLVEIQGSGDTRNEYRVVLDLFRESMPSACKIKSIRRVQNQDLWEDFNRKKQKMKKTCAAGKDPEEKLLFHGTKKKYESGICQQGFDWRLSGTSVGSLYGQGSYFHKKASYSKDYTNYCTLFVVRVLVGDFAAGNSSLRIPPVKVASGSKNACDVLYDSCVDKVQDPSIYVIFEASQAYPAYLIRFEQ